MTMISAMTISALVSAGFVIGVVAVAVWASHRPTQQSILVAQLTRVPDKYPLFRGIGGAFAQSAVRGHTRAYRI